MTLNAFILVLKKLLLKGKAFQLIIDCKNDGSLHFNSIKSENLLNELLTDEKE